MFLINSETKVDLLPSTKDGVINYVRELASLLCYGSLECSRFENIIHNTWAIFY